MKTIVARTLGEAWIEAMRDVMAKGEDIFDEDVRLKEIRNMYITIDEAGENDEILVEYANKERIALMKEKYATCGLVGDYKTDYGSRIFNNNGINQLEWIINRMKKKPETKAATISLHIPGEDLLPCLSLMDFKLRNSKLDMTVVYRSQNIYWSQPGNVLALRKMQEDVVKAVGCKPGKVELIAISAHIYEKDYEAVQVILRDAEKR